MELFLMSLMYVSLFITVYWLQVIFMNDSKIKKLNRHLSISIAVPAYNEEETIEDAIKSLQGLDYPKDKVEIIIVDDGSTDKTSDAVKGFKDVKLIRQANSGKASALNNALRNATGELFVCLDADSRIEKDALKKIVPHFSDSSIASVISAIKVDAPKSFVEKLQWYEYLMSAFFRKLISRLDALNMTPGVFSVYRRSVLLKIKGFDENNITEDFEMAMRLHKNGYNIKIENESVGYTKAPSKLNDLVRQRERWARGYLYNAWKYKGMFFNKRYGTLGMFHLPTTFLGVILIITTTMILLFKFSKKFFNSVIDISELKMDIFRLYEWPKLKILLNVDNMLYFPIIIGLIIVLYSFYRAHKMANEKLRYPLVFIVYIMYYGFLHSFVWMKAIAKEIARTKRRW